MTETKPIDFEVLPPKSTDVPDLARLIAWVLDDLIPIPGTKFRIGLDPIIGLIPGFGDGSTAVISSMILVHGLRAGVPRIVLVRMAINVLINSLVGAIPGAGDIFSAFFKSNRRNYELLQRHLGKNLKQTSTASDWIFVSVLIVAILTLAIAASVAVAFVCIHLFKLLLTL